MYAIMFSLEQSLKRTPFQRGKLEEKAQGAVSSFTDPVQGEDQTLIRTYMTGVSEPYSMLTSNIGVHGDTDMHCYWSTGCASNLSLKA